jgi:hypothetical protein
MNCTTSTCHHVGGDEDSKQIGFWMVGGMSCGCNCCLAVTYIWMKHRQMYDRIHSYADTVSNRLSQRPLFSDMDAFDKDMCERLDQLELLISTQKETMEAVKYQEAALAERRFLDYLIQQNLEKERYMNEQIEKMSEGEKQLETKRNLAIEADKRFRRIETQILEKQAELLGVEELVNEQLGLLQTRQSIEDMTQQAKVLEERIRTLEEREHDLKVAVWSQEDLLEERKEALRWSTQELEDRLRDRDEDLLTRIDIACSNLSRIEADVREKNQLVGTLSEAEASLKERIAIMESACVEKSSELQMILLKEKWLKDAVVDRLKKVDVLMTRARHGRVEEVLELLNKGIPVDSQDKNGNTLLHIAAQNNNLRILQVCVNCRANMNLQNNSGNTALHYATTYKYEDIVQVLTSGGTDLSLKNHAGLLPLEGAVKEGSPPAHRRASISTDSDGKGRGKAAAKWKKANDKIAKVRFSSAELS